MEGAEWGQCVPGGGSGPGGCRFLPLRRAGRMKPESHCEWGSWGPWWGGGHSQPSGAWLPLGGQRELACLPACLRAACLAGAAGRCFPAWLSWLGLAVWWGAWWVVSPLELGCAALFPSFSCAQPFASLWFEPGWLADGSGGSQVGGELSRALCCASGPSAAAASATGVMSCVCG